MPVALGPAFLATISRWLIKQVDLCRNSAIGTKRSDHNKEVVLTTIDRFHHIITCKYLFCAEVPPPSAAAEGKDSSASPSGAERPAVGGEEKKEGGLSLVEQRSSVFDNDEFDVFRREAVDLSRVQIGKK